MTCWPTWTRFHGPWGAKFEILHRTAERGLHICCWCRSQQLSCGFHYKLPWWPLWCFTFWPRVLYESRTPSSGIFIFIAYILLSLPLLQTQFGHPSPFSCQSKMHSDHSTKTIQISFTSSLCETYEPSSRPNSFIKAPVQTTREGTPLAFWFLPS